MAPSTLLSQHHQPVARLNLDTAVQEQGPGVTTVTVIVVLSWLTADAGADPSGPPVAELACGTVITVIGTGSMMPLPLPVSVGVGPRMLAVESIGVVMVATLVLVSTTVPAVTVRTIEVVTVCSTIEAHPTWPNCSSGTKSRLPEPLEIVIRLQVLVAAPAHCLPQPML